MSNDFALTTVDNPYNPFEQFDDWFAFDTQKHYNTCVLLSNFALTSIDLDEEENEKEIDEAMDKIIELFNGKIFRKVTRDDYPIEVKDPFEE